MNLLDDDTDDLETEAQAPQTEFRLEVALTADDAGERLDKVLATRFESLSRARLQSLIADGRLSLEGLITHSAPANDAPAAYRTAFSDPSCLKMILDWSACS